MYIHKNQSGLDWINTARSDNKNFYFEIAFEYRGDEIIIKVTTGNESCDYLLDAGIEISIIKLKNKPVVYSSTVTEVVIGNTIIE
ncbi:MAG: hypothetical protein ABI687_04990 [Flavitalea sp.]